jgi:hypothetical protein
MTPPDTIPELFAPGIINTGLSSRDISVSADSCSIYFGVSDVSVTAIFETKQDEDGKWTEPVVASFSGKPFFDLEPHLSPDGSMFFFLSNRPSANREPKNGWYYQNIWMMHETLTGWSEPVMLGNLCNKDEYCYFPSATTDNTLYFTRSAKSGTPRIYKSKLKNGTYSEPEILPIDVPEEGLIYNAFVSPDEDFLIFCALSIDSTNQDPDYYISFNNRNGKWGRPLRFGPEINSEEDIASSAFVSRDGRYMFFSSSRKIPGKLVIKGGTSLKSIIASKTIPGNGSSAIYWVDASIIEKLRHQTSSEEQ